jgi:hypothetical protein
MFYYSCLQNVTVLYFTTRYKQLCILAVCLFRCFSPEEHHNKLLLSVDPKDLVCTHQSADQKRSYSGHVVLDVFIIVAVLIISGVILVFLRYRGWIYCTVRKTVGTYSQVNIEPNRAELEWDDKDLDHIWSTPGSKRGP